MQVIVVLGALFSMFGGVLNTTFSTSRIIYAMGRDALLPTILAKTNESTQTPVIATMLGGVPFIFMAVFLNFTSVVEILSLTSIFDFIIVAMMCIILRYRKPNFEHTKQHITEEILLNKIHSHESTTDVPMKYIDDINGNGATPNNKHIETTHLLATHDLKQQKKDLSSIISAFKRLVDLNPVTTVVICLVIIIFSSVIAIYILMNMIEVSTGNWCVVFLLTVSTVLAGVACVPLWILPQNSEDIPFKVIGAVNKSLYENHFLPIYIYH